MTRSIRNIIVIIIILILIGGAAYLITNAKKPFPYESTLPEEPSPQMLDFFRHKIFSREAPISTNHQDGYIYTDIQIIDHQSFISYAFSPTVKIEQYYRERRQSDAEDKYAYKNVNPYSYLEVVSEPTKYDLPEISISEDALTIQTSEEQMTFSKMALDNGMEFEVSQTHHVNVVHANEDAFYLSISESENDELNRYLLFVKQDLSDYQIIEDEDGAFEEFMKTKYFTEYMSLFPSIDENGAYLNYYTHDQVIDVKNNTLITIDSEDYLSDDGKYVYLSGNDGSTPGEGISKGKQSIQKVEDYIAGNDKKHVTFDLHYKRIKNASDIGGIGTSVSGSGGKTVYFDQELLVIHIAYDAALFGIAGYTNVVVDFHEDNEQPNFYILDLSAR